jgi:hypothetical protein
MPALSLRGTLPVASLPLGRGRSTGILCIGCAFFGTAEPAGSLIGAAPAFPCAGTPMVEP